MQKKGCQNRLSISSLFIVHLLYRHLIRLTLKAFRIKTLEYKLHGPQPIMGACKLQVVITKGSFFRKLSQTVQKAMAVKHVSSSQNHGFRIKSSKKYYHIPYVTHACNLYAAYNML